MQTVCGHMAPGEAVRGAPGTTKVVLKVLTVKRECITTTSLLRKKRANLKLMSNSSDGWLLIIKRLAVAEKPLRIVILV